MQEIHLTLHIPVHEMMRYYRGEAQLAFVHAEDGRSVQLPAAALRPFVSDNGIHGRFVLRLDVNNRLLALERCLVPAGK